MNNDFKQMALFCKQFRQSKGIRQTQVAQEIGCGISNISSFERGKNNNAVIYNWYIRNGLLDYLDYLKKGRTV